VASNGPRRRRPAAATGAALDPHRRLSARATVRRGKLTVTLYGL